MSPPGRLLGLWLAVGAGVLAACIEERPRPGPPVLGIVFDRTSVSSPDTVSGRVRAEDVDGLDSVWLTVDSSRSGQDGYLDRVFSSRFLHNLPGGIPPGTRVPVRLEARGLSGFISILDTSVRVVP